MNLALAAWKMTFQLSPILLTGGIAQNVPYGVLPIIVFTEALNFVNGLLSGANIDLDNFFGHFVPVVGATLIQQDIGYYPFANQAVAANAVIAQPLQASLAMHCPVRDEAGYLTKLATLMALKAALELHNGSGGTYTVATPSFFYTDMLLTSVRDVSSGESNQQQISWQFDFVQPLLTQRAAQQAQSALMGKLTGQTKILPGADGSIAWSGLSSAVGSSTAVTAASLIPAASGAGGASVSSTLNAVTTPFASAFGP